mmetsp:Transcript_157915/g.483946  ORF Transcript_157915/g.483946 Transcript_157915/m.483946 type:complete len:256 (-) Transcript_157915:216-983(-)
MPSSCPSEWAEDASVAGEVTEDHVPRRGEASLVDVGLLAGALLETAARGRPLLCRLGGGCGLARAARQGHAPQRRRAEPGSPGVAPRRSAASCSSSTTTRYGALSLEERTRASAAGSRSSAAPVCGSGALAAFGVSICTGTGTASTMCSLTCSWIRRERSCCRAFLSLTFTISSPMVCKRSKRSTNGVAPRAPSGTCGKGWRRFKASFAAWILDMAVATCAWAAIVRVTSCSFRSASNFVLASACGEVITHFSAQ